MRTILCFGDSNTWGCVPLTAPEPPRRYEPVGRLELFAREVHRLLA